MTEAKGMIDVLEVDQWTATGNVREIGWDYLRAHGVGAVSGGGSEAAKAIFGGRVWFRTVKSTDSPSIGNVWFIRSEDGMPVRYKENVDSSD